MTTRSLAAASITIYQRHLSPRKGFQCAHRRLYGGESCSTYGKRLVVETGLWRAMTALRQRFGDCKQASRVLKEARADKGDADESKKKSRGEAGGDGCDTDWCDSLTCGTVLVGGLLSGVR